MKRIRMVGHGWAYPVALLLCLALCFGCFGVRWPMATRRRARSDADRDADCDTHCDANRDADCDAHCDADRKVDRDAAGGTRRHSDAGAGKW